MGYSAIGYHSGFRTGRTAGTITIDVSFLTFTHPGGSLKLPLQGIELTAGGTGNRLIFIKHHAFRDWTLSTTERRLLKDSSLASLANTNRSLSKIKTSHHTLWSVVGGTVVLLVVCLAVLFFFRKSVVFYIASQVPVRWEQEAGEEIFKTIVQEKQLLNDSLLSVRVNELGVLVTRSVQDTSFRFKFHVVKDTTLNAFALPGGNVVIHSGLIQRAESAGEVLGVLGHEIAHVTRRHHARGLINRMGINFLLISFFDTGSELANLILNTGSSLQSLQYDRDLEREADEFGWDYLVAQRIDPQGMIAFFEKIEAESKSIQTGMEFDWLSTHPATTERIATLKSKREKYGQKEFRPISFDFKTFQQTLNQAISK